MPRTRTTSHGKDESVRVVVRCRPMNEKEKSNGCEKVVQIDEARRQISIRKRKGIGEDGQTFFFDAVYDSNSKQRDVYDQTAHSLVESVLQGFNGTIFAYGQTGTGKTFTMEGVRSHIDLRGIIPSSFAQIFNSIGQSQSRQFLVRASYLEIYNESIRDLLSRDQNKRLNLQEHPKEGVFVHDLSSFITKNSQEIEQVMTTGNLNRSTGATNMNEHSSRSHAIFMITVESSELDENEKAHIRVGKLNLVDLAGSERQAKTGATGDRFKEATNINLSLSVLGNVISALVDGNSHIPYRDSKLTRLLQNSLGGNSKTVMIATIGPADYNYEESLTTLRYANRAKNIKNQPRINEDPKDALMRKFQEEITRLKEQLEGKGRKKSRQRRQTDENDDEGDDDELYLQQRRDELNDEKRTILQKKNLNEAERQALLNELEEQQRQIEREQDERREMLIKVEQMESKLITGGKDIVAHTTEQEEILRQKKRLIVEAERRRREFEEQLAKDEEERQNFAKKYANIRDEVEDKRNQRDRLAKHLRKIDEKKSEIIERHRIKREDLEKEQREIEKQMKLAQLIIRNFIPQDERERLFKRIQFDEKNRLWTLKELSKETDRSMMIERPSFRRKQHVDIQSQYFKGENIFLHQLDFPTRSTRDYEGPTVSPMIKATMEKALENEENIDLDVHDVSKEKHRKKSRERRSIPTSSMNYSNESVSRLDSTRRGRH